MAQSRVWLARSLPRHMTSTTVPVKSAADAAVARARAKKASFIATIMPQNRAVLSGPATPGSRNDWGAQKQDPWLRSLLRETIFVMQAGQYGSLHHPVSERQTVSSLVGREPGSTWAQT